MVLGDVKDDRACLEQLQIALLISRDQPKRMKAQMRGFRLCLKRDKAHLVGLPYLFKRPANARIAREAQAAVGRSVKRGDDDGHRSPLSPVEVIGRGTRPTSKTHRQPLRSRPQTRSGAST